MPSVAKPSASINFNASDSRRLQHKKESARFNADALQKTGLRPQKLQTRQPCPDAFGALGSTPSLCLSLFVLAISHQLRLVLFQIFFHRGTGFQANGNSLLTQISQVAVMAKRLAQLNDLDMKLAHFPQLPDLQNRLCLCFLIRLHKSPFSSNLLRFVNFNRKRKRRVPKRKRALLCV